MNEEHILKYHEMVKELMRDFHIIEYVTRRHKYAEDRIAEYAKLYQQAYELYTIIGERYSNEKTIE